MGYLSVTIFSPDSLFKRVALINNTMLIDDTKIWKQHCCKKLTPEQREVVDIIRKNFDFKSYHIKILANFCEYNVQDDWIERYSRVVKFIKAHGNIQTEESYILKYGDVIGAKKYKDYCNKKINNKASFIRRYGEKHGIDKYKAFCQKNTGNKTLSRFIDRYGETLGPIRYDEYRQKEIEKGTLEYKIKKHGLQLGTEIYKKHLAALHFGASLQGFIKKYGEEEGPARCKNAKNNTSLSSFQSRYGIEEGLEKYNIFIERMRYKNTLPGKVEKYGEEEGTKRYYQWVKASTVGSVSPISQELFWRIDNSDTSYFAEKNSEFVACNGISSYFFDYTDCRLKKIIEFNGDVYHGNPDIFSPNDTPNPRNKKITCKKMWERDARKIKFIESLGYTVLIVWERDYRQDKDKIVEQCKKFLYEE